MQIVILGTGCPKCKVLEDKTREMVEELNLQASINKESDIMKIMEYGVLRTPGLVVDGKLVLSGRIPTKEEIKKILTL